MELLRKIVIFFLINLVETKTFDISEAMSNATQAQELCKLAEPHYIGRRRVTLNSTEIRNPRDDDSIWIGYVREIAAFQYRGCTKTSNIQSSKNATTYRNIGLCYTFCGGGYIGVENRQCYCLSSIPDRIQRNHCDTSCGTPNGTSCGNANLNGNSYSAIYEKVPSTHSESNYSQRCRAYSDEKHLFWSECTATYKTLCSKGYTDNIEYITINNQHNWLMGNNACLQTKYFPYNQGTFPLNLEPNTTYWTGTIRNYIFTPVSDTDGTEQWMTQGYIRYNASINEFLLRFNQQQNEKRALCQIDITTESPSSSHVPVTITTTFRNGMTSEHTNFSDGTLSTRESTASQTYSTTGTISQEYRKDTAAKEDTDIVGVYVAVPLFLILIAAIVGFILWRKRTRQATKKPNDKGAILKDKKRNNGIDNAISNSAYQDEFQIGTKQETAEHNYHILEPANEYSAIDDTVQTTDENDYDTTSHGIVKGDVVADRSGNIYNRFDDEAQDTYNHTNTASARIDDTYNHTKINNVMDVPNNTYSHLEGTSMNGNTLLTKVKRHCTEFVEDRYDHTGDIIPGIQQPAMNSNGNSKMITKFSDSTAGNRKQSYDYAVVTNAGQNCASKPSAFTFSQTPTSGDYEFAQEPPAPGYELAKPLNIYLELSKDE